MKRINFVCDVKDDGTTQCRGFGYTVTAEDLRAALMKWVDLIEERIKALPPNAPTTCSTYDMQCQSRMQDYIEEGSSHSDGRPAIR